MVGHQKGLLLRDDTQAEETNQIWLYGAHCPEQKNSVTMVAPTILVGNPDVRGVHHTGDEICIVRSMRLGLHRQLVLPKR